MDAAGNGKRDDHQRRHRGGRVYGYSRPTERTQRNKRGKRGENKDQQRACDRAKQDADDKQHRHKHARGQRFAILLTGRCKGLADRHRPAGLEFDIGIFRAVARQKRFGLGIDVRDFRDKIHPGKPEDNRNGRRAAVGADQAVDDLDPVKRRVASGGSLFRCDGLRVGDEVLDHHHVPVGIGVLEPRDRIDQPHIGKVPKLLGQVADRAKGARREHIAVCRLDDNRQIVVLGELLLEPVEKNPVRVVSRHEDAAIGVEFQIGNAREDDEG